MMQLLLVGIGGCLGSICRYATGLAAQRLITTTLPVATLIVNAVGCLVIGITMGVIEAKGITDPTVRLFMVVGFLGGFTTFSAFGYETFSLATDGRLAVAIANGITQMTVGLLSVWAGHTLATQLST